MVSDFFLSIKVVVSGWIDVWRFLVFSRSSFPVFCGLDAVSASSLCVVEQNGPMAGHYTYSDTKQTYVGMAHARSDTDSTAA